MQPATAWLTRPCSYRMATSHQRLMIATESLHASSSLRSASNIAAVLEIQYTLPMSHHALMRFCMQSTKACAEEVAEMETPPCRGVRARTCLPRVGVWKHQVCVGGIAHHRASMRVESSLNAGLAWVCRR